MGNVTATFIQRAVPEVRLLEWTRRAACSGADPELFFAPELERAPERLEREARALAYCTVCPVREDCLADAMGRYDFAGIWGGLNDTGRAMLRADLPERCRRGHLFTPETTRWSGPTRVCRVCARVSEERRA